MIVGPGKSRLRGGPQPQGGAGVAAQVRRASAAEALCPGGGQSFCSWGRRTLIINDAVCVTHSPLIKVLISSKKHLHMTPGCL